MAPCGFVTSANVNNMVRKGCFSLPRTHFRNFEGASRFYADHIKTSRVDTYTREPSAQQGTTRQTSVLIDLGLGKCSQSPALRKALVGMSSVVLNMSCPLCHSLHACDKFSATPFPVIQPLPP